MSNFIKGFNETMILTGRNIKHIFRNVEGLIQLAVSSIMILLLFHFLFGGALEQTLDGVSYINFVVPGLIVLAIGQLTQTISVSINHEYKKGIVNRFRSMPISKSAFVISQIIAGMIRNLIAIVILIGFSFILGFNPTTNITNWILVILIILLVVFTFSVLGFLFGTIAKTPEGAGAFGMTMFFIPYLTNGFIPAETFPAPLEWFAINQPLNHVIEAIRYLMVGVGERNFVLSSIIWLSAISLLGLFFSIRAYNKRT